MNERHRQETPEGFISNGYGVTHFTEGLGTTKKPFIPAFGTELKDALLDAFHSASELIDLPTEERLVHLLWQSGNNNIHFTVNHQMEANMSAAQIEKYQNFWQILQEDIAKLRKAGHRPLTKPELDIFTEELKNKQSRIDKAQRRLDFLNKITEKLGF